MTFLKTILVILLVFYGLKILFRLAMPYILQSLAKKAEKHFQNTFGDGFREHPAQQPEGKVTIEKKQKQYKKSNTNVGEYVDFEEID